MKALNIKKIQIEKILLFFRQSNQLSYKIITQNILSELDKFDCIKMILLPKSEIKDNAIKSYIFTNLEIQDAFLDNNKLKELYKKDKFLNSWNEPNQSLIAKLLTKIFETKGIKLMIGKDNTFKELSKRCLQNISVGFTEIKKYEFHFKTKNDSLLLNNLDEYYNFIEKLRQNLSKELKIPSENIIFGPPRKGSVIVPLALIKENIKNLDLERIKKTNLDLGELVEINKLPIYEYIYLDQNIFDPRYNNQDDEKWGNREKRGKEEYIPPKGWIGFGLNVEDNYDNGNAEWLCFGGIYENEFAIAYYPIKEEDNDILFESDIQNIDEFDYYNLIAKSIDNRSGESELETGKGTILYQDIKFAQKQASFIDIDENNLFKIALMCRVNPKTIRAPKDYKELWVLNPNSEEIRPYRILIKRFERSEFHGKPPKDFYQFYSFSKTFSECLLKKNTSILQEQIPQGLTPVEYPIYLYKDNSGPLTDYLLFKKTNDSNSEERLQSWVYCLHNCLTDINLKTEKMGLVQDGIIVYSGAHFDQCALNEEFKIGRKLYFGKFLSTSLDRQKALEFTYGSGFLFVITIRNNENNNYCYNIERFATINNPGYQDDEREILITAFALFEISNIIRGDEISEIHLDCLGFDKDIFNND